MCGIIGAMLFEGIEDKVMLNMRTEAVIYLMTELLYMTHTRGKDATGIAALFADSNYCGLKMGIPSSEFIVRFGEKETKITRLVRKEMSSFFIMTFKSQISNNKIQTNR